MSHRIWLLLTGLFVIGIGLWLLLAPVSYVRLYVTEYAPGMDFAARRFGPAVLGMGVLLILARNLATCRFLSALCVVTGLVFWGVALTGMHAFVTDTARASILVAVGIEIVIGAIMLATGRQVAKSL